jgi:hypothetical protein
MLKEFKYMFKNNSQNFYAYESDLHYFSIMQSYQLIIYEYICISIYLYITSNHNDETLRVSSQVMAEERDLMGAIYFFTAFKTIVILIFRENDRLFVYILYKQVV